MVGWLASGVIVSRSDIGVASGHLANVLRGAATLRGGARTVEASALPSLVCA